MKTKRSKPTEMSTSKKPRNRGRCLECGDIIESLYRHDFKFCKCQKSFVDGGNDYMRWGGSVVTLEEYDKKKAERVQG